MTVGKEDGRTSTRLVSRQLGIDPAYARVLCMNLTKADYLDQETHGHFQITMKGKNALGWSREVQQPPSLVGKAGKVQIEEFHWRTFPVARAGKDLRARVLFKSGQEDPGWNTMCVGNNGTVKHRQ